MHIVDGALSLPVLLGGSSLAVVGIVATPPAMAGVSARARVNALLVVLLAVLLCIAPPAAAHKVVISAWPLGSDIEGEVGFSNGQMAAPGTRIKVFGPDRALLGEAKVGDDGLFRFTPSAAVPHTLRADLGAGHVAETTLPVDELPARAIADAPAVREHNGPARKHAQDAFAATTIEHDALRALVASAVQQEIRPLRRELIRLRETRHLHEIIGGIGYIAGLFGVLFFVYARRARRA